jgi:hypothetical protein
MTKDGEPTVNPKIDAMFPGLEEGCVLVAGVRNLALPHPQTGAREFSRSGRRGRGRLNLEGELTKYAFDKSSRAQIDLASQKTSDAAYTTPKD